MEAEETNPDLRRPKLDRGMDGTEPITDYESKNVMIVGERGDIIRIEEIVESYSSVKIPDDFSIIRRETRYYGPELVLHANLDGDQNYLLHAPGPNTFLHLWKAQKDEYNRRKGYNLIAEVKASIWEVGEYELCDQCGEPLDSIEHERYASIGKCPNN